MKRVLVLSNMYPSKDHLTFGIFVENQVSLLKSAGLDVDVLAIDNPGKGKMTTLLKYMSWFFRSFFYMAVHRNKLALTHAHYAFPTGFISLVGKKMFKLPYVVTVHGGDIDKMAAKSPAIAKMTKRILMEADSVIVVGEKLRKDVTERFGVMDDRVEVMSMGVDTSIFKRLSKEDARTQLGLPIHGQVILYVGNIIKAKGLLELVDAFKSIQVSHPETSLYLIGSKKDSGFVSSLKENLNEENIQSVHFEEPKSQVEIAKWMAAADVFVLPSHHEGFGLVALEAMATGTSVVGTDVGGLSYLLDDQAGILVKPQDSLSLSEGIVKALDPLSVEIDEHICHKKVEKHSFKTILSKLLAIYEEIGRK